MILNLVGFSRGAASTMVVAHDALSSTWAVRDRIKSVNIMAFDPVPGQADGCVPREAFHLDPLVKNYVGLYGRDEQ